MTRLLRICLRDLWAHRGRSLVTFSAMLVGVLAATAVAALGTFAEHALVAAAERDGLREGSYRVALVSSHYAGPPAEVWHEFAARTQPGTGLAMRSQQSLLVNPRGAEPVDISVTIYWGDLSRVRLLDIGAGRWATGSNPPQVVVNQAAAATLPGLWPVGRDRGRVDGELLITGVVDDGGTQPHAYLPGPQAEALGIAPVPSLEVIVTTGYDGAQSVIRRWAVEATAGSGWKVDDVSRADTVGDLRAQIRVMTQAFLLASAIALGIAALGILNIGLSTVGQRSRELCIRRAVGARRVDLFAQVMGSTLLIGASAAVTAVLASQAAAIWVLPRYLPDVGQALVPWQAVITAVGAALLTACLGGLIPAWRASRLEIAGVLRD